MGRIARTIGAGSALGVALIDVLVALAIVLMLLGLSAPVTASVTDASRARHAASFLSSRFRLARQEAVARGVNVGVVFDFAGGTWSLRVCRDGTGNGLRRAEIQTGADPCVEGPYDLGDLFQGLDIAIDATLRGPAGEPPSADPVRFGSANLVSFSPLGSCTSGSLYLRSRTGDQYAVRVTGVTGRIRVLRYERGPGWQEL